MTKVDSKAKRGISRQWQEIFPGFDVWRPLRLLRRIGPVLQGITLDVASSGTEYYPTAHVHALTADFPVVSLTLAHRLLAPSGVQYRISVEDDEVTIRAAGDTLRVQSPLPLDRAPTLEEVLAEYRNFLASEPSARYGFIPEVEDLALLAAFSREAGQTSAQIEYVRQLSARWTSPPGGYETKDAWLEQLEARMTNKAALEDSVEGRAKRLKVERVRRKLA